MKTRIITALVLFVVTLPILIFSGSIALPIAASFLSLVGVWEILQCLGLGKSKSIVVPSLIFAFLVPLGTILLHQDAWCAALGMSVSKYLLLFVFCAFLYLVCSFTTGVLHRGRLRYSDVASAIVMVIYIVFCFTSILLLRRQPLGGPMLYLVFVGPFMTDIFAYFTGFFFGKHKLNPEISPKKTIEGSVGGTVFGAASFPLYGLIVQVVTKNVDGMVALAPNYWMLAVIGLAVALVSQIGDLAASWIKREHGIKDYGKIFPGHGGVMDRFDSVLISAPILLFFSAFTGSLAMFAPVC